MNRESTIDAPTTAKGRATRERIVATASSLVYRHGISGTSTDQVQRAAAVSASQLYHYFRDKRSLIRAVIAYQTRAVLAAQEPYLGHLDSIEALYAWRDHVLSMQAPRADRSGCPLGTLAYEIDADWTEARADLARSFAEWETGIREGLRTMQERGELRHDADSERLALALLAGLQGGLLLTGTRRDSAALDAVLTALIDHIAILATPAGTSTPRREPPVHRQADHTGTAEPRG